MQGESASKDLPEVSLTRLTGSCEKQKMQYTEPYKGQWFHDILKRDGLPYSAAEAEYIKQMTGARASLPFIARR